MDKQQTQKENDWHIATLTENEQEQLKQMENDLGFVLIAYENDQQKQAKENS